MRSANLIPCATSRKLIRIQIPISNAAITTSDASAPETTVAKATITCPRSLSACSQVSNSATSSVRAWPPKSRPAHVIRKIEAVSIAATSATVTIGLITKGSDALPGIAACITPIARAFNVTTSASAVRIASWPRHCQGADF